MRRTQWLIASRVELVRGQVVVRVGVLARLQVLLRLLRLAMGRLQVLLAMGQPQAQVLGLELQQSLGGKAVGQLWQQPLD